MPAGPLNLVRHTAGSPLPSTPDYFIAPFTPDGQLIGVAGRALAELSPKWLAFCRELLASHGSTFRCPIPLPSLQHITLQVTSAGGTALVSLLVNDQPASSAVALTGQEPGAEAEVLKMFVESLRRVTLVQQAAATSKPFESLFSLRERPLYAVVLWANPQISEEDQQLVQELENHLAGALTAS